MLYACVWVCAGGRERKKRSKCGKMVTTVEFRRKVFGCLSFFQFFISSNIFKIKS